MFIGHYGVSFALKRAEPKLPLWALFLAVQGIDLLWAVFILAGIEKARLVPHFLPASPLDLYYMPYTHSLVGALFWSIVVYRLTVALSKSPKAGRMGALLGVAVFSHWVLDLVVHTKDLSLYDDTGKMGFGMWNYPVQTFFVELVLLAAGVAMCTRGPAKIARNRLLVLLAVLLGFHVFNFWGTPPSTINAFAIMAEALYFVIAGVAWWAERPEVSLTP